MALQDQYDLLEELGQGGMGVVYKAQHKFLNTIVAVKRIHTHKCADPVFVERFIREARAAHKLRHPNIVPVHTIGKDDKGLFLIMDYIPGTNLRQRIKTSGPLDVETTLSIGRQLAQALHYAHQQGFIHRDVKTANVLLHKNVAMLTDFGQVYHDENEDLTDPDTDIGTAAYRSPELWAKQTLDGRSDLYSLGILLYECLTGHWPHEGDALQIMRQLFDEEVKPAPLTMYRSDVPDWLAEAIHTCLAMQPDARFSSGATLAQTLEARGVFVDDRPTTPLPGHRRTFRNSIGMAFVRLEPGVFWMGSPDSEAGHQDDEYRHEVELSGGFWMGQYPVTQSEFGAFVEATGYKTTSEQGGGSWVWNGKTWVQDSTKHWHNVFVGDRRPVVCVSWHDAQAFIEWLNAKEGTDAYRLPRESEWEYACRAGTQTPFSFGPTITPDQANYDGNYSYGTGTGAGLLQKLFKQKKLYRQETTPVSSFSPNGWGLYDVHGNVWEWVADWYAKDYYRVSPRVDPLGPERGTYRVLRGGSWFDPPNALRSAFRNSYHPEYSDDHAGFRLSRTL